MTSPLILLSPHDSATIPPLAVPSPIVLFAGAGVSAGAPSSLPSWWELNTLIAEHLGRRLIAAVGRSEWIEQAVAIIAQARTENRLPPEYQAQLIEEMCGKRYFAALACLDVRVRNSGHEAIATLARTGRVRAIVTTNFDRLIELALAEQGVRHRIARDEAEFGVLASDLAAAGPSTTSDVTLIKVHGCVSRPASMIDTLKQRRRGRSAALQAALDALHAGNHWAYLGFSAADLDGNPAYLGLCAGAARSAGATFVTYPGASKPLGPGATSLIEAYRGRCSTVRAHVTDFLQILTGSAKPIAVAAPTADRGALSGKPLVAENLTLWASRLSGAAAGLALAGLLEATGEAERAARLLDRLVRKERERLQVEAPADYAALQLHYGRLGLAWSRFVRVPDLNGMPSNASGESVQSLFRLEASARRFEARTWATCGLLWLGLGQEALAETARITEGLIREDWGSLPPPHEEARLDAWIAAMQVLVFHLDSKIVRFVGARSAELRQRAHACGDVVRFVRITAFEFMVMSETSAALPEMLAAHQEEWAEARRLNEHLALGLRALALGRWRLGVGGKAMLPTGQSAEERQRAQQELARQALLDLDEANTRLSRQGTDFWVMYGWLQQAKAFADLQEWDPTQDRMQAVAENLDRFPLLEPLYAEVGLQLFLMQGRGAEAAKAHQRAVESAQALGLPLLAERMESYRPAVSPVQG